MTRTRAHAPDLHGLEQLDTPLMRLVPPALGAKRVARWLGVALCAAATLAALAPWQQSAAGSGRVIAFEPLERQQTLEAPIEGRVVRWLVNEGERVEEGQLLLEMSDNDPQLFERLEQERTLTRDRMTTYAARVAALEERLLAIENAQAGAVRAADARVDMARDRLAASDQAVTAADAELDAQGVNLERTRDLAEQGLVSAARARARDPRRGEGAHGGGGRGECARCRARGPRRRERGAPAGTGHDARGDRERAGHAGVGAHRSPGRRDCAAAHRLAARATRPAGGHRAARGLGVPHPSEPHGRAGQGG